jgi:NAD(P)-dependent dehydrogenase (short-subunit alcohol dehydrogenase family)
VTPPLDGLVAVVTGGAGHLGAVMTETMAHQGASVAVADIDGEKAAAHADTLVAAGLNAIGLAVDVASAGSVTDALESSASAASTCS